MVVTAPYDEPLAWIDTQHQRMRGLVEQWAAVNSGTEHLAGLERLTGLLTEAFAVLGGRCRLVDLDPAQRVGRDGRVSQTPLAKAIHITKRPDAPLQVFLGIHMDTVFPCDHPFQKVREVAPNKLNGPGVADAKGGLAVMLVALEALERCRAADALGWEVLINSDEEIGSPGSAALLAACGRRNDLGLVYEPSLDDSGTLAGQRGGSGNFVAVLRGKAAHAGRQFHLGRNAIDAMAQLISGLGALNGRVDRATVNVGCVEGGGAVNIVPDLAICRFNVRVQDQAAAAQIDPHLERIVGEVRQRDGIRVELHGGWTSPPKPMSDAAARLFDHVASCGRDLGLSVNTAATGGVCDGNKLAAAGLPTIDTLGPRGGQIHSEGEYLLLDSLTERAKLSALLLMKLASGELAWTARPS